MSVASFWLGGRKVLNSNGIAKSYGVQIGRMAEWVVRRSEGREWGRAGHWAVGGVGWVEVHVHAGICQ